MPELGLEVNHLLRLWRELDHELPLETILSLAFHVLHFGPGLEEGVHLRDLGLEFVSKLAFFSLDHKAVSINL